MHKKSVKILHPFIIISLNELNTKGMNLDMKRPYMTTTHPIPYSVMQL